MYVRLSPSRGSTQDAGLGFDFDFSSIGDIFGKIAPSVAQVYAAKQGVDMQTKLLKAQAAQQAAINQAAMYPPSPYPPGYGAAPGMFPGHGAGIGDGLPSWAIPAGVAAGVGVLALVLMRR